MKEREIIQRFANALAMTPQQIKKLKQTTKLIWQADKQKTDLASPKTLKLQ